MNVIVIHQNFPGQFRHLIAYLASSPKNRVISICQSQAPGIRDKQFAPVLKSVYRPHRTPSQKIHPYMLNVEKQILNGQGVARALLDLRKKGFKETVGPVCPFRLPAELSQYPVRCKKERGRLNPCGTVITAPLPVFRGFDHMCPYRIGDHIPAEFEEVAVSSLLRDCRRDILS